MSLHYLTTKESNMTLFDFLSQASFWQWIGVLILTSIVFSCLVGIAHGLGRFRFWGNYTENRFKNKQ